MATAPQEFIDLASELIGASGEFAAFRKPCVFTKSGTFNFEAQTATKSTLTVQMIEAGILEGQVQSKPLAQNEIELVGLYSDFSFIPSVGNSKFSYSGKTYNLNNVEIDPAQATITVMGSI
jgi:hypothetical protein